MLREKFVSYDRARANYFAGCVLVCLVLVLTTGLHQLGAHRFLDGDPFIIRFLRRAIVTLNLGGENNLAAWWSGTFLLVLCLHACDGYAFHKRTSREVARAWGFIAGVLLFFSLDEIGSIHERLATLGKNLDLGSWGFILPLGAILGVLLGRALLTLWQARGQQRRLAVLLGIGFALLGSVAFQEYLEHWIQWDSPEVKAIRMMIEEGTELAGMLILLWASMGNTGPFSRRLAGQDCPTFAILTVHWRLMVTTVLIIGPLAAVFTSAVHHDGRGRPADWVAGSLFLLAALLSVRSWLARGEIIPYVRSLMLGLCLLASVVQPQIAASRLSYGAEVSKRLVVLGFLCLVLALVRYLSSSKKPTALAISCVVLAMTAIVAPLVSTATWGVYLLSQYLALGAFVVVAVDVQEG